jgi:hypothetical protein
VQAEEEEEKEGEEQEEEEKEEKEKKRKKQDETQENEERKETRSHASVGVRPLVSLCLCGSRLSALYTELERRTRGEENEGRMKGE